MTNPASRPRKRLPKLVRLNARIDSDLARKIAVLSRTRQQTTTEVIRESISLLYEVHRHAGQKLLTELAGFGFVDALTAEPTLSERYQSVVTARSRTKL